MATTSPYSPAGPIETSYMVVESGVHKLSSGAYYEAGKIAMGAANENILFSTTPLFPDTTNPSPNVVVFV